MSDNQRKGPPAVVKRIQRALARDNPEWDEDRTYAVAWNVVKRACATGDLNFPGMQQANKAFRAECCSAVRTLKH